MDQRIKQRLVGAAVLVAVAVIFIPIILEGPEDEFGPWGTKMPKPPGKTSFSTLETLTLPDRGASEPVRRIVLDASKTEAEPQKKASTPTSKSVSKPVARKPAVKKNTSKPATKSEPKPVPVKQPKAVVDKKLQSWVVQVASFGREENALALRERLRKNGYKTFVEKITAKNKKIYRVRVGPELERSEAQTIRDRIEKETKLNGVVTRYP